MDSKENSKRLKQMRDDLYWMQVDYEESNLTDKALDQSIRVGQRIRALLDIYSQILGGREFEEEYLENYLK